MNRLLFYGASGKPEEAASIVRKSFFALVQSLFMGYFLQVLAWLYNLVGQYEKAAEMYRKAIQKNPQDYLGYVGYSISTGLLGRTEEASGSVKELLRLKPSIFN